MEFATYVRAGCWFLLGSWVIEGLEFFFMVMVFW